jgi:DNA modification methylase
MTTFDPRYIKGIEHFNRREFYDAGWIVRDKIVWHKLAPMPSSATDRCTGAWEPVYHLTKQQRYYADMEAVRQEPVDYERPHCDTPYTADDLWRNGKDSLSLHRTNPNGRNLRNVWSLSPAPFDSAALGVDVDHYATFPPELPRRCVAIGTSEKGVCSKCGKPWVRVVERESVATQPGRGKAGRGGWGRNDIGAGRNGMFVTTTKDHGWQPSCKCDAPVAPAVVLDPFAGSGTTLLVANRLSRHAIGIELNPAYARLAEARIRADAGMFANVEVIE